MTPVEQVAQALQRIAAQPNCNTCHGVVPPLRRIDTARAERRRAIISAETRVKG